MVGRLDGAASMDAHRFVRLAGREGRDDQAGKEIAVGDVLEGLCDIGACRSDQEQAALCHVCPTEATTHSASNWGPRTVRSASPLGPGALSCGVPALSGLSP